MRDEILTITENTEIAPGVFRMKLQSPCGSAAETVPGQFLNLKPEGCFLRRPISICDADADSYTILYKVVGTGTGRMAGMGAGETIAALTGLGNGFSVEENARRCLLAGGGIGTAPLYLLAKKLIAAGKTVCAATGFASAADVFLEDEFRAIGAELRLATADGSRGVKGFVTDAMAGCDYDYLYTCGPEPMLRAVFKACGTGGQFSFEERMGCGFGACMGCSCKTVTGWKRICRDGPVLRKEEILWED